MDFVWLYENLADYKSKYILYAILNNYYNFDFISLGKVTNDIYKHYFDLDILKLQQDEVFVDMGAYIGDTILDFINSYGTDSYKKIYCYEITKDILAEFGKYSMNIWFLHCMFFNVTKDIFQPIAFYPGNPILVLLWVMLLCFVIVKIIDVVKTKWLKVYKCFNI